MNKKELLDQLLKDQREGKLKDPKFITKVELQYRDPEPEKKEPEKIEKAWGSYPPSISPPSPFSMRTTSDSAKPESGGQKPWGKKPTEKEIYNIESSVPKTLHHVYHYYRANGYNHDDSVKRVNNPNDLAVSRYGKNPNAFKGTFKDWDSTEKSEDLDKMYGGAHTWRGGSYPGGNKSADQMAEEKRITEQSQKEISEVPEHLHDHYKAMRRGGLYGGSKGLTHEAAKQVLTLATGPGSGVTQAASILMDRGHNASQARQVIGDIQASHKRGK